MTRTLVILAGGKSRRFGRSKQLEPVGANGETLIEYSIYDALRSGIDRVVVIASPENVEELESALGDVSGRVDLQFAVQKTCFPDRNKPLGTAHALLSAAGSLNGPFAILNADDFYGAAAFAKAAAFMTCLDSKKPVIGLLGYRLGNTIHNSSPVSRALCATSRDGQLKAVKEQTVTRKEDGQFTALDAAGVSQQLLGNERVSMNFWIMFPETLHLMQREFERFALDPVNIREKEFALPDVIQKLSEAGEVLVNVIEEDAVTIGLSHPGDRDGVVSFLSDMHRQGCYPMQLWGEAN